MKLQQWLSPLILFFSSRPQHSMTSTFDSSQKQNEHHLGHYQKRSQLFLHHTNRMALSSGFLNPKWHHLLLDCLGILRPCGHSFRSSRRHQPTTNTGLFWNPVHHSSASLSRNIHAKFFRGSQTEVICSSSFLPHFKC